MVRWWYVVGARNHGLTGGINLTAGTDRHQQRPTRPWGPTAVRREPLNLSAWPQANDRQHEAGGRPRSHAVE